MGWFGRCRIGSNMVGVSSRVGGGSMIEFRAGEGMAVGCVPLIGVD